MSSRTRSLIPTLITVAVCAVGVWLLFYVEGGWWIVLSIMAWGLIDDGLTKIFLKLWEVKKDKDAGS